MDFADQHEMAIGLVQQRLEDEFQAGFPYLAKIPSLAVIQSVSRYRTYAIDERRRLSRAIGIRALYFLGRDLGWRGSEAEKLYWTFLDNRPWPDQLGQNTAAPGESVKTVIDSALTRLLKRPEKRCLNSTTFEYTGVLAEVGLTIQLAFARKCSEFTIGTTTRRIASLLDGHRNYAPSYDGLLGFGAGSWDQLSEAAIEQIPTIVVDEVEATVDLSEKLCGALAR